MPTGNMASRRAGTPALLVCFLAVVTAASSIFAAARATPGALLSAAPSAPDPAGAVRVVIQHLSSVHHPALQNQIPMSLTFTSPSYIRDADGNAIVLVTLLTCVPPLLFMLSLSFLIPARCPRRPRHRPYRSSRVAGRRSRRYVRCAPIRPHPRTRRSRRPRFRNRLSACLIQTLLQRAGIHPNPGPDGADTEVRHHLDPGWNKFANRLITAQLPIPTVLELWITKMKGHRTQTKYWTQSDVDGQVNFRTKDEWKANMRLGYQLLRDSGDPSVTHGRLLSLAMDGASSDDKEAATFVNRVKEYLREASTAYEQSKLVVAIASRAASPIPLDPRGYPLAAAVAWLPLDPAWPEITLIAEIRKRADRTRSSTPGFFAPLYRSEDDWRHETFAILDHAVTTGLQRDALRALCEGDIELFNKWSLRTTTAQRPKRQAPAPNAARFARDPEQELLNYDADDIPTTTVLPPVRVPLWVALVQRHIGGYCAADREGRTKRIHALLSCPKNYLRTLQGSSTSRQRKAFALQQLGGMKLRDGGGKRADPKDADKRAIGQCLKLLQMGYVSKGCRALMQDPAPPLPFDETVYLLDKLHPREAPSPLEIPCDGAYFKEANPEAFTKAAKKCASGASPGRTALSEELILYLLRDSFTKDDMSAIILDIVNNDVDPTVADRLRACRLIAIPKPAKPGAEPSLRPIAVGEALLKICASVVVESQAETLRDYFGDIQFGVGTPGGAETIVHRVRHNLANGSAVLVALDAANAFNSPYRCKIREVLMSNPRFAPFFPLWNLCYSTPSELHFRQGQNTATLTSQRGTRQGDVLGALFFAAVLQPILVRAKERSPLVDVYAYLDDITLQCDYAEQMEECVAHIRAEMLGIGMALNESKCEWFSQYLCPYPAWRHEDTGTIKLLGAFFGATAATSEALLDHTARKHEMFFHRIGQIKGRHRMVLLHQCGIPRFNYLVRTHAPCVAEAAARWFDSHVEDAIVTFAGISPSDPHALRIARLSTEFGGGGFHSYFDIRDIAYTASFTFAMHPDTAIPQHVAAAAHMQRQYDELAKSAQVKLRLDENKGKGISSFFRAPLDYGCPIRPAAAEAAMRLYLNSLREDLPRPPSCPGCHLNLSVEAANDHLRGCARIHSHNAAAAHAELKKGIHSLLARRSIAFDHKEPDVEVVVCPSCKTVVERHLIDEHLAAGGSTCDARALKDARLMRPDIRFYTKAGPCCIDVTFVALGMRFPSLDTDTQVQRNLCGRQRRKHLLYRSVVQKHGESFLACATTALGTLSPEFTTFTQIVAEASIIADDTPGKVESELRAVIVQASGQSLINAENQIMRLPPPALVTAAAADAVAVAATQQAQPDTAVAPESAMTNYAILYTREVLAAMRTHAAEVTFRAATGNFFEPLQPSSQAAVFRGAYAPFAPDDGFSSHLMAVFLAPGNCNRYPLSFAFWNAPAVYPAVRANFEARDYDAMNDTYLRQIDALLARLEPTAGPLLARYQISPREAFMGVPLPPRERRLLMIRDAISAAFSEYTLHIAGDVARRHEGASPEVIEQFATSLSSAAKSELTDDPLRVAEASARNLTAMPAETPVEMKAERYVTRFLRHGSYPSVPLDLAKDLGLAPYTPVAKSILRGCRAVVERSLARTADANASAPGAVGVHALSRLSTDWSSRPSAGPHDNSRSPSAAAPSLPHLPIRPESIDTNSTQPPLTARRPDGLRPPSLHSSAAPSQAASRQGSPAEVPIGLPQQGRISANTSRPTSHQGSPAQLPISLPDNHTWAMANSQGTHSDGEQTWRASIRLDAPTLGTTIGIATWQPLQH